MSRMISEARALNNGKQVRQIYRVSLMAFLSIGIIGSALMLASLVLVEVDVGALFGKNKKKAE